VNHLFEFRDDKFYELFKIWSLIYYPWFNVYKLIWVVKAVFAHKLLDFVKDLHKFEIIEVKGFLFILKNFLPVLDQVLNHFFQNIGVF